MRWAFGRNSKLHEQVHKLRSELEECKQDHDRDRAAWREECDRLHAVICQQGETIHALTQGLSAEQPIHTYLSQFAAVVFVALGGEAVLATFFGIENATVQLVVFVLLGTGVIALLVASQLFKRLRALQANGEDNLRMAAAGAGLYILGAVLFIVSTVLYVLY